MKKRKTTEEFVERAQQVHGDRYDYSKVEYTFSKNKVCIVCPDHGEFWQISNSHLAGRGCSKCGFAKSKSVLKTKTTEQFIKDAKKAHGNKFDYSKTEYINNQVKVIIGCSKHGEFKQRPTSHVRGSGCRRCADEHAKSKARTTEQFIKDAKKAHGNKFDYSKAVYTGVHNKICVICPEHGEIWQIAGSHIRGYGCYKCAGLVKTTEQFIKDAKKAHGNKFDYSKVEYVNAHIKIIIVCPEHGDFKQTPTGHLKPNGCPYCGKNSIAENLTREALEEMFNISLPTTQSLYWLRNPKTNRYLELDGYNEQHKIAFEFQGLQHYEPIKWYDGKEGLEKRRYRDKIKNNLCLQNDVILVKIDGRLIPTKARTTKENIRPYVAEQLEKLSKHQKEQIVKRLSKENK